MHLMEISRQIAHKALKAHAVLLMDRASWHTTDNTSAPTGSQTAFLKPITRSLMRTAKPDQTYRPT